jgi:hypothetical protein
MRGTSCRAREEAMHDINPFFNRMGEENAFAVLARATALAY